VKAQASAKQLNLPKSVESVSLSVNKAQIQGMPGEGGKPWTTI
jgi:hypothetical protein